MSPREKLDYYRKEKEKLQQRIVSKTNTEGERRYFEGELKDVEEKIKYIEEEMKESQKIINDAMKVGTVSVNMTNVLMQGMAGVGKTSSKCILFDEPPPEVRSSTALADAPVQVHIRDVSGVKVQVGEKKWKPFKRKDLQQIVVETISSIASNLTNASEDTKRQLQELVDDIGRSRPIQSIPSQTTGESTSSQPTQQSTTSVDTTSSANIPSQSKPVDDHSSSFLCHVQVAIASLNGEIIDLMDKEKKWLRHPSSRDPSKILGSNWIYFIDSGGQPHFHNLMPHFTQGISVALFVHRLSERLDNHPMVEYYEEGRPICTPYRSPVSTEDTLKCLVRSMQSHTVDGEKPKLVFIGTFLDKILESSETLEEKNEQLLKLFTSELFDQLVFSDGAMDQLIFAIDAKNPGDHEAMVAQQIRSVVESCPSRKFDAPIWWYVFEIVLENLSNILGRKVFSKQECLEVAHYLKFNEGALTEALNFFHKQLILHYYSYILPNVVFASPQVLLDKLTELVQAVFDMREAITSPSTTPPRVSAPTNRRLRRLRDFGIITLRFLEGFPKHYVDGLFTPPELLKIFMNLLILTPFTAALHEQVDFTSHTAQYFMPSLLDMLHSSELEKHRVFASPAAPLLIHFPKGVILSGVFCCLQVYLIQRLGWMLVMSAGKLEIIAQNCVKLAHSERACTITLIDSFSHLEVHVGFKYYKLSVCQQICRSIRDDILNGVEASYRALRYQIDQPHLAFFCPCDYGVQSSGATPNPRQRHVAKLLEKDSCLQCLVQLANFPELTEKHKVWLDTDLELNRDNLTLELHELTDPIQFGSHLRIPQRELDVIEKAYQHPIDVVKQKSDLIDYIDRDHRSQNITWNRIANALHVTGYGDLSLRIRLKYCDRMGTSRTVKPGDRVELCSDVMLSSDPKYQWYCDERLVAAENPDFEGSRSPTMVIKECLSKHTGSYKCVVTGESGRIDVSEDTKLKLVGTIVEPEKAQLLGRMLRGVDSFKLAESGINIEDLSSGDSDLLLEELQFSLCKIPEVFEFANKLKENLESRMADEQMYQEAMEKDTILRLRYLKMLAIGPGQVGKSTFLRRLLGLMKWDIDTAEKESLPSCSTGQAEMRNVYLESRTVAVSSEKRWHTFESDCELERQFAAIALLLKDPEAVHIPVQFVPTPEVEEEPNIFPNVQPEQRDEPADRDSHPENTSGHKQPPNQPPMGKLPEVSEKTSSQHTNPISPKKTEIDKLYAKFEDLRVKRTLSSSSDDDVTSLNIIINTVDVGGQPAFLEMLPSLTIGPAMYLIFLKLLQGLKTPFPMMFRCEGDEEAESYKEYTYTSEEVIFTALSSIACFGLPDEDLMKYVVEENDSKRKDSLALLLGTFADQLEGESGETTIEEIQKQLKEQLEETSFYETGLVEYAHSSWQHQHKSRSGDRSSSRSTERHPSSSSQQHSFSKEKQVLFNVNNKSGGHAEVQRYRELLEKLIEQKFRKYAIPARWFMLSVFLKMLARNEGKSTVSVDDCVKIGQKFKMEEEMVKIALRFLHKYIGIVMYFPNNVHLKDLVICDPQIVFTSITELIFNIYDPKKSRLSPAECVRFIQRGRFSPEDITVKGRDDLLQIKYLVNLLVHLNIAAPIPSSPDYFLPAVLPSAKDEDLALPPHGLNDEELPEPLCIRFETGFLPLGFFCALVANLVAAKHFELLDSKQHQVVRKNKVTFRVRGRYDITLISWPTYCEVRFSRSPEAPTDEEFSDVACCPKVRQTLQEMINKVIREMRQSSLFQKSQGYSLGFKCTLHSAIPVSGHEPIALIEPKYDAGGIPDEINCVQCKTSSPLSEKMKVWYGEAIPATPILINEQPYKKVHLGENKNVTLSISVTGTKPLTYQWMKDGRNLEDSVYYQGCGTPKLDIKQADSDLSGKYYCEVRDRRGEHIVSRESELTTDKIFSSEMSCDNLCDWLRQNGIPDCDIEMFRGQAIDGDAFPLLSRHEDTLNKKLKGELTFGGWNKLKRLMACVGECSNGVHLNQSPLVKSSRGMSCSPSDDHQQEQTDMELNYDNLTLELHKLTDPIEFGSHLKIPLEDLNAIEKAYLNPVDIHKQKRKLIEYIARNDSRHRITWNSIADALLATGYGNLSLRIRKKYCNA